LYPPGKLLEDNAVIKKEVKKRVSFPTLALSRSGYTGLISAPKEHPG